MKTLWTIAWTNKETGNPESLVVPLDCNDNHEDQGMLVYESEQAAMESAAKQTEKYGSGDDEQGDAIAVTLQNWFGMFAEASC